MVPAPAPASRLMQMFWNRATAPETSRAARSLVAAPEEPADDEIGPEVMAGRQSAGVFGR